MFFSGFTRTVRAKGISHFAAIILLNRTILDQALKKYNVIHTFYEADNVWAILPTAKDATLAALEASRLVTLHNQTVSMSELSNFVFQFLIFFF